MKLCDRFHCLPYPGSLLEQPAVIIQWMKMDAIMQQEGGRDA